MKNILVANNDFSLSEQIINFLQDTDYSIAHTASSFEDAIDNINQNKPDIIIFDKNISDINNNKIILYSLLTELNIPIVFIVKNGSLNNSNTLTISDHIYVPFNKNELINILNQHIENNKIFNNAQIENIISECGIKAFYFIRDHIDISNSKNIFVSTTSSFNLKIFSDRELNAIVNLKRINDVRYLNKFFETINELLPNNGIFIGCAETKNLRKKRILNKFPPVLNYIYYTLDFIVKRILPKLPITKKIYFGLTQGHNRVLTKSEILGRLYSCGFEIIKDQPINNLFYFAVRKTKAPFYDNNASYGPLINIQRIGKNGKIIRVYKFRTMHPYSEYIQEYMYNENNLAEGGKIMNDIRITTIGKFLRRSWLDELPMLYNLLKGDIKLFGVRPLSQHYFSLYPEDFQKMRIKYKPGLVPPFYSDLPKTLEEIIESEKKYLAKYDKHPLITDFKYFFHAFYNIIFKKARSR